jgi:26S proteasome regulatory subunit N5
VSKTIYGKVDRLDGIVTFTPRQEPTEVLNQWSGRVNSLLELIARTTHLITKEEMVHKITKTA